MPLRGSGRAENGRLTLDAHFTFSPAPANFWGCSNGGSFR
jgi:hypothetical protein